MSMENERCENELQTHSLHEKNFDNNEVKCLMVFVSDKSRVTSAKKIDNTSAESTDTPEKIKEFPAVVVNLLSGQANQECKVEEEDKMEVQMEQPNIDETKQVSKSETAKRDDVPSERTLTKNTFLPNIELPCVQCGDIVNIYLLISHRRLHDALRKFRYAYEQKPMKLQCLLNRRLRLIKAEQELNVKNKQSSSVPDNRIHALNTAFEVLKLHIEGRHPLDEAVLNSSLPKAKGMLMDCVMAVGLCVEGNESWMHMEDAHTYQDNFLERIQSCYLGIYDGYFGKTSAHICAENLHVFVKENLDSYPCDENGELDKDYLTSAFKKAYQQTEKILLLKGEDERSHHRWSGCSAVTCVLTQTKCYLANLGNVAAMLLRSNGVVRVLTRKHDLYDKRERNRVRKSSGVIVKTANCALINGALGVTRGIGNIGDGALRSCVINEPRIRSVQLHETDQMIVLASSGLWRTFSYEEVVYLVNGFFQQINSEIKNCHTKEKNNSDLESVVGRQRRRSMEIFPQRNHEKKEYRYQGKHRWSLTSTHELLLIRELRGNPEVLSNRDKARYLAKSVSQRLVKSALLAGSKDNHTVFVVLLPGFCLVNLDHFTPDILTTVNAMTFNKLQNA